MDARDESQEHEKWRSRGPNYDGTLFEVTGIVKSSVGVVSLVNLSYGAQICAAATPSFRYVRP